MIRFISRRLWQPFDRVLGTIEHFRLENGACPLLEENDVKEFSRLNATLERQMTDSLNSYRLQKEFTENASHELQTPLAVFQSKLDLLLQLPELTERQAAIILYRPSENVKGNGLGLAIVKAVCDYHGWHIAYDYSEGMHTFAVRFL